MRRSGACHAVLLDKCAVGIACYGSSAVSAQLSEQCGDGALPASVGEA